MNVLGIICEFNPFHMGHKYLIDTAKKLSGADCVIAVMSGNYVQRGEPAFIDKYERTKTALKNGIDIVIELPCAYSLASAEYFSKAAVAILDKTCVVTHMAFGCECDDVSLLGGAAKLMENEPSYVSDAIKTHIRNGKNYAGAAYEAWSDVIAENLSADVNDVSALLKSPNNILALEYLKALSRRNSHIIPVPLKRICAGYHDASAKNSAYSSTALRNLILSSIPGRFTFDERREKTAAALSHIGYKKRIDNPDIDLRIRELYSDIKHILVSDDFSPVLMVHLLEKIMPDSHLISEYHADFTKYHDIGEDLSNKICKNASRFKGFDDFAALLKSRDMTLLRIKRALFHIMLGITKDDMQHYIEHDYVEYVRILGFRSEAAGLLGRIGDNINIIVNINDTNISGRMLNTSLYGDSLYRLVMMNKYKIDLPDEYSRKVLKH